MSIREQVTQKLKGGIKPSQIVIVEGGFKYTSPVLVNGKPHIRKSHVLKGGTQLVAL